MNILCLSTSNVRSHRETSASTKACELAKDAIVAAEPTAEVRVLRLLDYDLKPCEMCGTCFQTGMCPHDEAFNQIFTAMCWADGVVIVIPHYALAPAKLIILLEKLQERAFYHYVTKTIQQFPLVRKGLALIGHGGMESGYEGLYRRNLLDTISGVFAGIGMQAVGASAEEPNGVVFGLKGMQSDPDSVLPSMVHDWDEVRERIAPLMENFVQTFLNK